jgi:hypothetical protein
MAMANERFTEQELRLLRRSVWRAHEQGLGVAFGMLCGVGLFVATAILVVKGGPNPGAHLGLLRVYFPGYEVTWIGAAIGFVYAFVGGYAVGRTVAALYNRLTPR